MSVEIYIDDLKPDIQRQVLEELGLETAEDGNYDREAGMIFGAAHNFLIREGGQTPPHFYIHYEE